MNVPKTITSQIDLILVVIYLSNLNWLRLLINHLAIDVTTAWM
jgi:hypothetical protein